MQIPQALSPRRAMLILATLALAVFGVLVISRASGATARPVAHLALVKRDPVTITGRGFRPGVRVHLLLADPRTLTRHPLAGRNGRFTATFPATVDRCTG